MSTYPLANSQGAEVDCRGYVLCQFCREPVTEISKETRKEYAYHVEHRPWNHAAIDREEKKRVFFAQKKTEREVDCSDLI